MSDKTSIGDRMKSYEDTSRFMPGIPIMARLDGRAFHSFCRGLNKPFDERLHRLMVETTRFLVEETQPAIAYTQSDEISLTWLITDPQSQMIFDGRVQKLVSTLSALATLKFNQLLPEHLPEKSSLLPTFDCRVFQVPTQEEAANCFLWRERDATKNSISAAGQACFSHKELQGKNGSEIQEMLWQRGINWNDYPDWAKRGTWVQRYRVVRPYTVAELSELPVKHAARSNPDLTVERWAFRVGPFPPFGQVTNRVEVIFQGEEPR
jgi:tRNA(His) 5'-end guanylyltransferase